jgi:hypothetical protein
LSIFCRGEAKSRAVEEFVLYREEGYFFEKTTQWAKDVHEDIFDIISHFWPSVYVVKYIDGPKNWPNYFSKSKIILVC